MGVALARVNPNAAAFVERQKEGRFSFQIGAHIHFVQVLSLIHIYQIANMRVEQMNLVLEATRQTVMSKYAPGEDDLYMLSLIHILDKSRLSIRLVPPYSEERKAAASAYAKEHGFQVVGAEEKIA